MLTPPNVSDSSGTGGRLNAPQSTPAFWIRTRSCANSRIPIWLFSLPYTNSTESASGAICLPLASLTPVLSSDVALFRKYADIVHLFPAGDTVALANRLLELSTNTKLLRMFDAGQRKYVNELAWSNVARDFEAVVDSCTLTATQTV